MSQSALTAQVLKEQNAESIGQFVDILAENELCGFAVSSIYELKLHSEVQRIIVRYGAEESDLLATLVRQSATEAIKFETFDRQFTEFISVVSAFSNSVIWLKGLVTSRTCYGEPSTRLSSDFDCFVSPQILQDFSTAVYRVGYRIIIGDSGFCNQLGVGPVNSPAHLLLVPVEGLIPSAVIGFRKKHWPILDIKMNPLDRGLEMIELERFRANAVKLQWNGQLFFAPDLVDQLIITLTHLAKDRFKGWKQLLDVKLLAEKVSNNPEQWKEFVRRCRVEGISTDCWAGLSLARERLGLSCIDDVIEQLRPRDINFFRILTTFTVTPLFFWNTSMFPMLLLNAFVAEDSLRKKTILLKLFFPENDFLSSYYNGGRAMNPVTYFGALVLHWLVVFLPGGVVRRSFGRYVWSNEQTKGFTAASSIQ